MTISAICPKCQFSRDVRDSLKGREATCPKCKNAFVIGVALEHPPVPSQPPPVPPSVPPPSLTDAKKLLATPPPVIVSPSPPSQTTATKKAKVRNPLESTESSLSLCPTLHDQATFDEYRRNILSSIQTPLTVEKMTTGYKIGLFFLAMFMILLPLAYVALIAGFCLLEYFYFAWTYADYSNAMQDRGEGKGTVILTVLYFTIPVAFAAVIAILLKPLVFGWGGKDTRFEVTREREPLLFEFVQHLCRFVGAPMPRRVFVDCQVNAAAGMSRGIWGALFGGNECDLIIGLPLVAGMTTREFASILAHEFGHFTQAGTRRMTYLVQTVLWWFQHVYYYRDRMDLWIQAGARGGFHLLIMVACWIVLAFTWLVRRFIWVLMTLGNIAAGYMSRQMEFDADKFKVKLEGSAHFPVTTRKIIMLAIADQKTVADLNYMLQEERLADNYPLLIAANMVIHREELEGCAMKSIGDSKTGMFDSHPCDQDRIGAAKAMNEPGVLHEDRPASLLFRNFLGLSREVTLDFYKNEVGLEIKPGMLKNAGAVIDQLRRESLGHEAITKFFQRSFSVLRFLPVQTPEPPSSVREAEFRLKQARERQAALLAEVRDANKAFQKAEQQMCVAKYLRELLRLNAPVKMSKLKLEFKARNFHEMARAAELFEAQRNAQWGRLWNRDTVAAERLVCVRFLLQQPEIYGAIEGGSALAQRVETLFPLLQKIGPTQGEFDDAKTKYELISAWAECLPSLPEDKAGGLWRTMEEETDTLRRTTNQFRILFTHTPYPYEHGTAGSTFGSFLVPQWSETEMGPIDYFHAFGNLLGRLNTTYILALGECAAATLAVEEVLGLAPLFVPPPEVEEPKKT